MKRGKDQRENCVKTGVKGHTVASFWLMNFGYYKSKKRGGVIEVHNIYPCMLIYLLCVRRVSVTVIR